MAIDVKHGVVNENEFTTEPVDWKYADCNKEVYDILKETINEFFPSDYYINNESMNIRVMYYSKMRKHRGNVVAAYITKFTDLEDYLATRVDKDTTHYVIFIDWYIWNSLEKNYKKRLLRHELRHIHVDVNKKGELVLGLQGHDFEDFKVDIRYESSAEGGDPNWHDVLADVGMRVHEELKKKQKNEE